MEVLTSVFQYERPMYIMESYWTVTFRTIFRRGLRSYNLRRRWIVLLRHPRFFAMSSKEMKWKSSNQCRLGVERCGVYSGADKSPNHELMSPKKGFGVHPPKKMVADSKLIFFPQNQQKSPLKDQSSMVKSKGHDFGGCGLQTENVFQPRIGQCVKFWRRKALTLTGQMWIPEFTGWCVYWWAVFFFHRELDSKNRDFSIGQGLETRVTIEPLAKLMYQVVQSDLFIP